MRIYGLAAAAVVVSSMVVAWGQGAETGGLPEQAAPPALSRAPVGGPVRERPAVAAMNRPDVNSPAQAGRNALWQYLDAMAEKDTAARRAEIGRITTRAQAEVRQQEVRTKLLELMGGGFERTPLNAKVMGSTQMDGFRIERVMYESQPKFYVTALLYVPASVTNAKLPAVVMAPGHAASGKAGDFAMASAFARNGFVVLSYDPIGQGERLQYMDPKTATKVVAGSPYPGQSFASRATGEHGEAGLQPTLIGDAVGRYFAWDGVRAVDYLISRPEVDAEKIGAFGCSGGGAMTALLSAADKRVKATATACYLTTMDEVLPAVGAQDAEQSVPGFVASGFDFADWVELVAPRPYAMVGTVSDMFPWKGFLQTAVEARRFYSLFDASAEGVGSCRSQGAGCELKTPTGPTLNPDTANAVAASSPFQVIAGIGGHGNLKPIQAQIVGFFLVHLAGRKAEEYVGAPIQDSGRKVPEVAADRAASGSFDSGRGATSAQDDGFVRGAGPLAAPNVPKGTLQVTPTGQVATSYADAATVFSLNLERAKGKIPQFVKPQTLAQVQTDVRMVTRAEAVAGDPAPMNTQAADLVNPPEGSAHVRHRFTLATDPGIEIAAEFYRPADGKHKALLVLRDSLDPALEAGRADEVRRFRAMADAGTAVMVIAPRPSPPGGEEVKSPILGPFYLTELRAELVGKTLLGMRVDDVIRAVSFLAGGETIDPHDLSVEASGHLGLVALHAAVLDSRIKHVTVDHVLESYDSLLRAPMPLDAPQDVLPGVLLKYDVPDLVRVLEGRVTVSDPLPGTANLAGVKP